MINNIKELFEIISTYKACTSIGKKEIIINEINEFTGKYGSYIHPDTHFDNPPIFPHKLYGIFISRGAWIGTNCVIFHQVTIGSNSLIDSKKIGFPVIGNDVYIGAGAKIIGNITVGNNVRIGANCVITEDIPNNSLVVLPKIRIIEKQGEQDNRHFSFHKDTGWAYFKDSEIRMDISDKHLGLLKKLEK